MSVARRRLARDFKILQSDPPYGVSGAPIDNDILRWHAVIFGPEDTSWEGGTFRLELLFNHDYPNKPPIVRFVTRIFHPNVYCDGNICLDILQHQWSPTYDISAILTSIQSLLSDPNPNSPANSEAANLYTDNRREYNRRVYQCVADSWKAIEAETSSPTNAAHATDGSTATAVAAGSGSSGGAGGTAAGGGAAAGGGGEVVPSQQVQGGADSLSLRSAAARDDRPTVDEVITTSSTTSTTTNTGGTAGTATAVSTAESTAG